MGMRAIKTCYQGFQFRSLLEARWAVFFNALGIVWEYEPQGFELSTDEWYLPDFYLPAFDGGLWCEVKFKDGDFSKAMQLCKDSGWNVWKCEGPPTYAIYRVLTMQDGSLKTWCGIPNYSQAHCEDRMYAMPCEFDCGEFCDTSASAMPVPLGKTEFLAYESYSRVHQAIEIARTHQFTRGKVVKKEATADD